MYIGWANCDVRGTSVLTCGGKYRLLSAQYLFVIRARVHTIVVVCEIAVEAKSINTYTSECVLVQFVSYI